MWDRLTFCTSESRNFSVNRLYFGKSPILYTFRRVDFGKLILFGESSIFRESFENPREKLPYSLADFTQREALGATELYELERSAANVLHLASQRLEWLRSGAGFKIFDF